MRDWEDVNCPHANECFEGGPYGKGAYEDRLQNAMGGKPWHECHCMTQAERKALGIKEAPLKEPSPTSTLETVRPQIERLVQVIRACYGSKITERDLISGATEIVRVLPLEPHQVKDLEDIEQALKETKV